MKYTYLISLTIITTLLCVYIDNIFYCWEIYHKFIDSPVGSHLGFLAFTNEVAVKICMQFFEHMLAFFMANT